MARSPSLPMADIAAVYGVSPRTIRRWAQHDRWRRTGTRPVRYSLADAHRSYEAHHAGRIKRHLVQRYAVESGQISGTAASGKLGGRP